MTGAFRTYQPTVTRPVTDADLQTPEAQLAYALGPALRWQLWLFFPANDNGFGGLAMPCDDLPRRAPTDAADTLFTVIDGVAQHSGATELIIGLERRGGPDPGRLDREWMLAASTAADRAGVRLRAVLISHTRGVREHEPPAPTLAGMQPETAQFDA
ncbi:hypothetical protein [Microcella sp.]|uniref:hypothetical protein n=1 Tax=Microcella sp. TaxID=1913979 RepID=UPI00255FC027|nr:hypothetical protein [Microcella sp.]MBX9471059.1 hypothetical protein [Microcella sp.]